MKSFAVVCSLVLLAVPLTGGCQTATLVCANQLDGSALGFVMVVPARFSCSSLPPFSLGIIKANVTYQDTAAAQTLTVLVVTPSTDGSGNGATDGLTGQGQNLGQYTSPGGLVFSLSKATTDDGEISYVGVIELPSGDLLAVLLGTLTDDAALVDALKAILDTVQTV